jgi:hypothetical protein
MNVIKTLLGEYSAPKNAMDGIAPTKLRHSLQGFPPPGPNGFLWNRGVRLEYILPDRSQDHKSWDKVVVPTTEQWQAFWMVCDEIGVWSWPAKAHSDVEIVNGERVTCYFVDGLYYDLELEVGLQAVRSEGQLTRVPAVFREKVMKLHRALQALTGWQGEEEADDAPMRLKQMLRNSYVYWAIGGLRPEEEQYLDRMLPILRQQWNVQGQRWQDLVEAQLRLPPDFPEVIRKQYEKRAKLNIITEDFAQNFVHQHMSLPDERW